MGNKTEKNGITIDKNRANAMIKRILLYERTNIKTHTFSQTEILNKIQKIIEGECDVIRKD